jgi:hypothetical protein
MKYKVSDPAGEKRGIESQGKVRALTRAVR